MIHTLTTLINVMSPISSIAATLHSLRKTQQAIYLLWVTDEDTALDVLSLGSIVILRHGNLHKTWHVTKLMQLVSTCLVGFNFTCKSVIRDNITMTSMTWV